MKGAMTSEVDSIKPLIADWIRRYEAFRVEADLGGWPSFWWMDWRMGFNRVRDPWNREIEYLLQAERQSLKVDDEKFRDTTLRRIATLERLQSSPDAIVVEYVSLPEWGTEKVEGHEILVRLIVSAQTKTVHFLADPKRS